MTTLFALFTEKHFGFDAHQTGYVFGFIGIISVILQGGLIGRLVKMFGETALARTGLLLLALALFALPLVPTIPMLLLVSAALAIANGLVIPTLNGLASQMIDRGWQGRALGLMQSAGSLGRLVGPLLGGWLLMFDLNRPLVYYARTPFFASAAILLVAFALALEFRKPAPIELRPPSRSRRTLNPGSAIDSRARDGDLAVANFSFARSIRSIRVYPASSLRRVAATSTRGRVRSPALLLQSRDEANTSHSRRHWPRGLGRLAAGARRFFIRRQIRAHHRRLARARTRHRAADCGGRRPRRAPRPGRGGTPARLPRAARPRRRSTAGSRAICSTAGSR